MRHALQTFTFTDMNPAHCFVFLSWLMRQEWLQLRRQMAALGCHGSVIPSILRQSRQWQVTGTEPALSPPVINDTHIVDNTSSHTARLQLHRRVGALTIYITCNMYMVFHN